MDNEVGSVTSDTATDAVEPTTSPDATSQDTGTGSQAPQSSRTYTEADLQRVLRGRIEQQKRAYEKRLSEYEQRQSQYDQVVTRMNAGIENMGRGFGFIKDEQPQPVTRQDIEALNKSFDERWTKFQEEQQQKQIYSQISSDWKSVESKYASYSDLPGFKDAWAKGWEPGKDPMTVAAGLVAAYEKKFALRANENAQVKQDRLRSAPVKSGGGTASASGKEEKIPLRKQFLAALKNDD